MFKYESQINYKADVFFASALSSNIIKDLFSVMGYQLIDLRKR